MAYGKYDSGNFYGDTPQYRSLRKADQEDEATRIVRNFDPHNAAQNRSDAIRNNPANSLASLRQNPPVIRNPAQATPGQLNQLARDATPTTNSGRSDQSAYGLRANQNSRYSENFARLSKRIISKRGLTRAQRSSQLNALETTEKIRQEGYTGSDAAQALDLAGAATRRGLTRSQRTQLITSSDEILSNIRRDTAKQEKTQKTFAERLLDELDLYGDD